MSGANGVEAKPGMCRGDFVTIQAGLYRVSTVNETVAVVELAQE